MRQAKHIFHFLFWINSVLNLWATFVPSELLNFITKPLLMPLLVGYLLSASGKRQRASRNLVIAGLIWSCGGDILLMLTNQYANFFIFGLLCFLLAHVCYIVAFARITSFRQGFFHGQIVLAIPFLMYALALNIFLYEGIPSGLKIPVILYSIVIMIMAMGALNLRRTFTMDAFRWIFFGALLFVLSDSILAIQKFRPAILLTGVNAGLAIMLTYILGQYGIANGIVIATKAR